jgi:flagellin
VTSLNGYTGTITIAEGSISLTNVATTSKTAFGDISNIADGSFDKATAAFTISFSGADKLKAGDVITISLTAGHKADSTKEGKNSLHLQVGANAGQEINLSINSMKAKDLGIVQTSASTTDTSESVKGQALKVTTQEKASLAIEAYDKALQKVSTERAKLGAVQNRLEHTISNLDTSEENLQSAESRIRDVDMAEEMTSYSKSNILQQAGTSMLAQANQSNQTVLSLLG